MAKRNRRQIESLQSIERKSRVPAQEVYREPYRSSPRVRLLPRNTAQEVYVDMLNDDDARIVVASGPAGCGKSYLCVLKAIMALTSGEVTRIVLTRPAVSVDEEHGFLPGDLNEKMAPWVRPVMDIFEEYYKPLELKKMLDDKVIEIAPLAYMRGRSFKNCFIIAEEIQNCTPEQVKMLTTRMGEGCKMVITGDLNQHDRGFERNGLGDFIKKVECSESRSKMIKIARFNQNHIERDPIVSEVLKLYEDIVN